MRREVARPSLRDLAKSAGVTVPTLHHYFGARPQVIDAILEERLRLGREGLAEQAKSDLPFDASVRAFAADLLKSLKAEHDVRLGDVFAVSLAEGLVDSEISPSTLKHIVDPTISTLEERLRGHMAKGEMIQADARAAALMLLSPLLMASLHQDQLNGACVNPMALDALAEEVASAFVRAFAVRPATR
jgi:AcrR family transcriptional regulator